MDMRCKGPRHKAHKMAILTLFERIFRIKMKLITNESLSLCFLQSENRIGSIAAC